MVDVLLRYAPPGPDGSQVTFRVSRVPAEKKVSALRKAFLRAFAQKHGGSPTVEKLLRCADGAVLSEAATVGEALPRGEAVEVLWTAATPEPPAAAPPAPRAARGAERARAAGRGRARASSARAAARCGNEALARGDRAGALAAYARAVTALDACAAPRAYGRARRRAPRCRRGLRRGRRLRHPRRRTARARRAEARGARGPEARGARGGAAAAEPRAARTAVAAAVEVPEGAKLGPLRVGFLGFDGRPRWGTFGPRDVGRRVDRAALEDDARAPPARRVAPRRARGGGGVTWRGDAESHVLLRAVVSEAERARLEAIILALKDAARPAEPGGRGASSRATTTTLAHCDSLRPVIDRRAVDVDDGDAWAFLASKREHETTVSAAAARASSSASAGPSPREVPPADRAETRRRRGAPGPVSKTPGRNSEF
ncbi:hypothetical protein SO694_00058017 [Aureococcus anophagefferens]|uniref:Ubiquitin-like domain-containing protein n=1 Tax=Aureococcus anophagefferens TaxID=44056 RepID=A0ABR1FYV0_AURAN